jgi:hypothetical protein
MGALLFIPAMAALILTVPDEAASTAPDDLAVYRAEAQAARGADAHVRLALWCEAHGLTREYDAELAEALRLNPNHAGARGLCGMVRTGGSWSKPGEPAEPSPGNRALDARRAEYDEKRAASGDTAQDHVKLAAWCLAQGLSGESRLHLTAALRRDPAQPEVLRKLGYKLHQNHWVNATHEAQEKRRFVEARDAHRVWEAKLTQWAHALDNREPQAAAEAELAAVHDPNAVPAIWSVVVKAGNFAGAVRLFSQFEGPEATSRIALMAMGSGHLGMMSRQAWLVLNISPPGDEAIDALRNRDPREYIGPLIDYLRPPMNLDVRPINGPGNPGVIIVDGVPIQQFPIESWTEYKIRTTPPVIPAPVLAGSGTTLAPHTQGKPAGGVQVTYHPPDPAVAQAFAHAMANPAAAPQVFAQYNNVAGAGHVAPPPVVYDVKTAKKPSGSAPKSDGTLRTRSVDQLDVEYERYAQRVEDQFRIVVDMWQRRLDQQVKDSERVHELLKTLTGLDLPLDQQAWGNWWKAWNGCDRRLM